jgi:hypothetical protein
MSLEAATNISQLNPSNPVSNDQVQQGDDHIRMIKNVLQFCFPNATKPFNFPSTIVKSSNFSLLSTDMNVTFLVDTTGGIVTATLPSLAAADAGWEAAFIKTNTGTNTMFIAPASGTIQSGELVGLAKTRRCIPGRRTRVLWTGTAWIADRVNSLPIGSIVPCDAAALPTGYEIPNGQTLGANYPDFILAKGSGLTRDTTGRAIFGQEAAPTRLTVAGSGIDGSVVGASGGGQTVTLSSGNLPSGLQVSGSTTGQLTGSVGTVVTSVNEVDDSNVQHGGGNLIRGLDSPKQNTNNGNFTTSGNLSFSANLPGSSNPINKIPPAMVLPFLLLVE